MKGSRRSGNTRACTAHLVGFLSTLLLVAAFTAAGCGDGGSSGPPPPQTPTASPTPPPTQVAGAGLVSEILDAGVASDPAGQVSVTFTLTDENAIASTATTSSAENDQQARTRFALAHLEEYSGGGDLANTFFRYVNEINATQPAYDSGGALELVDAVTGTYRYTFATTLPAGYEALLH